MLCAYVNQAFCGKFVEGPQDVRLKLSRWRVIDHSELSQKRCYRDRRAEPPPNIAACGAQTVAAVPFEVHQNYFVVNLCRHSFGAPADDRVLAYFRVFHDSFL